MQHAAMYTALQVRRAQCITQTADEATSAWKEAITHCAAAACRQTAAVCARLQTSTAGDCPLYCVIMSVKGLHNCCENSIANTELHAQQLGKNKTLLCVTVVQSSSTTSAGTMSSSI
eukprot:10174-Heterococcus_DN1.PRE.3